MHLHVLMLQHTRVCAHIHCMHWWDLAWSVWGRSSLPQGTAPDRICLCEGSIFTQNLTT